MTRALQPRGEGHSPSSPGCSRRVTTAASAALDRSNVPRAVRGGSRQHSYLPSYVQEAALSAMRRRAETSTAAVRTAERTARTESAGNPPRCWHDGGLMTITRLTPEHADTYRALMLQGYALHPEAFTASVAERSPLPISWWQQRLQRGDDVHEMVLGAWSGDELAGVAGLAFETRERSSHKAMLFGMYVAPPFRHAGLGRQLVQAVLAEARRRPATLLVQLTVTAGNAGAQALYASCGFAPFGNEPMAVRLGHGYVSKVHMWCDLGKLPATSAGG
jgi:GNAT superfamily N-acetyltransferase